MSRLAPALLPLLLVAALAATRPAGVSSMPSPARARSLAPRLATAPDGTVFMSWLERRDSTRHALRVARLDGTRWSAPRTIAEGDSFFANWADVPALLALDRSRLAAAWAWKSGAGPYAYDVRLAFSTDAGATWSRPVIPHRDRTATEHGFVSLAPAGSGVRAVWLDGRNGAHTAGPDHGDAGEWDMTLRTALVARNGRLSEESELDPRVCECCPTAAAATSAGVVVAYRDRGPDEIRDVALARRFGTRWSTGDFVRRDRWKIAGCPVNGPALDARGPRAALAWFTAAGDSARVWVALSADGGARFGRPIRIDGGAPIGRVGVALLPDGGAWVTWLEGAGEEAGLRARPVSASGVAGAPLTVATTQAGRSAGVPRVARSGDHLIVAWTDAGEPSRVRVARLPSRR